MAHWIADETGGDILRVLAKDEYPESYNDTTDRAKKEKNDGVRPEITVSLTPEQMEKYDTVFLKRSPRLGAGSEPGLTRPGERSAGKNSSMNHTLPAVGIAPTAGRVLYDSSIKRFKVVLLAVNSSAHSQRRNTPLKKPCNTDPEQSQRFVQRSIRCAYNA